jgi:4-hydroxybenzoyl-CoA reductase subunit alpha
MGLGQALSEEVRFSRRGLILNPSLLEYKVPGVVESPRVEVVIVESGDPEGPFGAKEAGEGSLGAVIPALTNAIYDAVGVWITELPVTPHRVLAALEERKRQRLKQERSATREVPALS